MLDAGCGSGRVTRVLLERLPRGRVIAVDASPDMVARAREELAREAVDVRQADLATLSLGGGEQVDAVFSNATFHWIADHDALFARLAAALRPGGRVSVQCGGEGNVAAVQAQALRAADDAGLGDRFADWRGPWNFAGAGADRGPPARRRLRGRALLDAGVARRTRRATRVSPDRLPRTPPRASRAG